MTRTVIALEPTSSAMAPLSEPLATVVKLPIVPLRTPSVAEAWFAVGVSFTCVVAFATVAT